MKTITQFKSIEFFSTQRLTAKKLTSADKNNFISMHTNAKVMATLGGIRHEQQSVDNLNWNLVGREWLWSVDVLSQRYEVVGRGGLRRVKVDGRMQIEVAYALMPTFWHQGFATEITAACIEIAFEVLGLDTIVCFTFTTNKASQRVMEKVGFTYERDIMQCNLPHVLYRMNNSRVIEVV